MQKEKIVAGVITVLLVGALGLFLAGGASSIKGLLSGMKWWSTEETSSISPAGKSSGGRKHRRRRRKGRRNSTTSSDVGTVVDNLDGVPVYYNGRVRHVSGRNLAPDGYNLGLKYQCVEFVKRYYYEHYHHKMPNAGGNAADYFDSRLKDGAYNSARGLYQFHNGAGTKPRKGDIVVFVGPNYTRFGHIAIVSGVYSDHIQIIQQNPGPGNPSRVDLPLIRTSGRWKVNAAELVGWLGRR